jgi:hypothetical protein
MEKTPQFGQGLLGNPLFGMGIGLMSGAAPGGTFAGGAQAGLQNMMLMQGQNQRNQLQDLQMKRMQADQAEQERVRVLQETMRASGNPEWLGDPAQAAQSQPYMQSEAEMFPGEQPMGGLMNDQPAQDASGMYAQNPQMAGLMSDMYQNDPMQTQQLMAESMMDNTTQPFGFNQYQNAPESVRDLYDSYKGWDQPGDVPSDLQVYDAYKNMSPEQKKDFRDSKRAPQWLDVGPSFVDPSAPTGAPTLDTAVPPAPLDAGAPPPQPPGRVEKDIIGKAVQTAEGGDVGKRLVNYTNDMAVSEELLLSIEETQGQLAELFGMTSYETTGVASFLNNLPASDARAWENLKVTLQSRMGLDKMMELKAGSSTGSTGFGALNTKELELLVSNLGKLDQASDPKDIKRVIMSINRQLGDKTGRIRAKMGEQRSWYDSNKHQLTEGSQVGDPNVMNWDDLQE